MRSMRSPPARLRPRRGTDSRPPRAVVAREYCVSATSPAADIAVLGAGSWGTALAIQCARAGRRTRLWGREASHIELLARERRNRRYLPEASFPDGLQPVVTLAQALAGVSDVIVAVPSDA